MDQEGVALINCSKPVTTLPQGKSNCIFWRRCLATNFPKMNRVRGVQIRYPGGKSGLVITCMIKSSLGLSFLLNLCKLIFTLNEPLN